MRNVIDMHTRKPLDPRELTSAERMQAQLLAEMNDDRASLCTKDQPALKTFFQMNAAFLRAIAHTRQP